MDHIIVVSGMPRSGTSLMMQMLAAGGIPLVTDGRRPADEHNPKGYFEDQRVLRLAKDSAWLKESNGKAVKVIYRLLPHLPANLTYKVLFLHRDLEEIYASQQSMLESRADAAAGQNKHAILKALAEDLDRIEAWLKTKPNLQVLKLNYQDLLTDAPDAVRQIESFLQRPLHLDRMVDAVDPALYRHHRP